MKRLLLSILGVILCVELCSCGFIFKKSTYTVALITGMSGIQNHGAAQGSYEGISAYCDANGISYKEYTPETNDAEEISSLVDNAVSSGASLVVFAGIYMGDDAEKAISKYPETDFLLVDCKVASPTDRVFTISFREDEAGFIAGYASFIEGCRSYGFIAGEKNEISERYLSGYVQGIQYAASIFKLQVPKIRCWFTGTLLPSDEIKKVATEWYGDGVDAIIVCGEGIYKSISLAANIMKGKMLGCELDQAGISELFLTSAKKDISGVVEKVLEDYFKSEKWTKDYAGKTKVYGLDVDAVGLPTSYGSFRFKNIVLDSYESFYARLKSGTLGVNITEEIPLFYESMIEYHEEGLSETSEESSASSEESETVIPVKK